MLATLINFNFSVYRPIYYYGSLYHGFQSTALPNEQCTTTFDGTSAACPVASAIVALALEVK